jgi:hypothetical protein
MSIWNVTPLEVYSGCYLEVMGAERRSRKRLEEQDGAIIALSGGRTSGLKCPLTPGPKCPIFVDNTQR